MVGSIYQIIIIIVVNNNKSLYQLLACDQSGIKNHQAILTAFIINIMTAVNKVIYKLSF